MNALNGRLTGLVARVLDLPAAQVEDASADSTPGWDSLAHLRLLMAVEEEYGVSFSPDEIADLDSVRRIGNAVERLLDEKAP
ncbi:MAG TPA: acyl carrier protein [Candidatus Limnocylindria bacterium]|jgi:acyl carrier protein|nr:acyl carrier protein [Candidatus Limnocylindria bacterium]